MRYDYLEIWKSKYWDNPVLMIQIKFFLIIFTVVNLLNIFMEPDFYYLTFSNIVIILA